MDFQEPSKYVNKEVSISFRRQRIVFIHNEFLMLLCSKIPNVKDRVRRRLNILLKSTVDCLHVLFLGQHCLQPHKIV